MIEVKIPKDIREYEPTLVATFTTRQVICGIAMLFCVYGVWMLEKAAGVENPMNMPLFVIPAIPFVLVGWVKPYGMKFEKFFITALIDNFICPKYRKMAIDNLYDVAQREQEKELMKDPAYAKEKAMAKKKKHMEPPRASLPQELRPYRERFPSVHKRISAEQTYLF